MEQELKPYPKLLNRQESSDLLEMAEWLWDDLQKNDLGGFSDGNRPFYILGEFKRIIEDFGGRDIGFRWSKNQLEAHPDHPGNEGE